MSGGRQTMEGAVILVAFVLVLAIVLHGCASTMMTWEVSSW